MKVYECEIVDERENFLELIKVVGDESMNRLRRVLSRFGCDLIENNVKKIGE